jgi:hypothetical protein
MQKISLLIAVAALVFGASTQSSEAAAAWKCKKRHCFWTEGYTGAVPDYAAAWGAPQAPGCYYVQGRFSKRWAHYCPPSNPPMQ